MCVRHATIASNFDQAALPLHALCGSRSSSTRNACRLDAAMPSLVSKVLSRRRVRRKAAEDGRPRRTGAIVQRRMEKFAAVIIQRMYRWHLQHKCTPAYWMKRDLEALSRMELVNTLRRVGLPTEGRKHELLQRMREWVNAPKQAKKQILEMQQAVQQESREAMGRRVAPLTRCASLTRCAAHALRAMPARPQCVHVRQEQQWPTRPW